MTKDFFPLHIKMLNDELASRKLRNHRYSLRAFAQFLGIGSSTLSRILMNTQEISASNSKLIMDKLNYSHDERMLFIASISEEKRMRSFEMMSNFIDPANSDWLLSKSPEMIFVFNRLCQLIYVNEEGAKLHGKTPRQLIGLTLKEAGAPFKVAEKIEDEVRLTFQQNLKSISEDEYPLGNEVIWMERIYVPVLGRKQEVTAVACHVRDMTQRKLAEQKLRLLVDIGNLLYTTYDYRISLSKVVDKIAATLGDGCFIHIMDQQHDVKMFKAVHRDSSKQEILRKLFEQYPYEPNFPGFYHQVFRTGEPQFIPLVDEDKLSKLYRNEEHSRALKELSVHSYMCLPMKALDRTMGTMTVLRSKGNVSFDQNDFILIKEICSRVGWSIGCTMKVCQENLNA